MGVISLWFSAAICLTLGIAAVFLGSGTDSNMFAVGMLVMAFVAIVLPFTNLAAQIPPPPGYVVFLGAMIMTAIVAGLGFHNPWIPLLAVDAGAVAMLFGARRNRSPQ